MQKDVPGFINYFVTDDGKIFSKNYHREGRIAELKSRIGDNGYPYVVLCRNGIRYTKHVHRIVAEAFILNPEKKTTVNHKNGNKTDNRIQNLEWATLSENIQHAYDVLNKRPNKPFVGKFGKDHPTHKVVIQIKNNEVIKEFYGLHEAERETGISRVSIKLVCQGKRNHAGGYQWAYKK